MKKLFSVILALALLLSAVPSFGESSAERFPVPGNVVEGFEVKEVREFGLIGATLVYFEHQKTGAKLLYIANDDTNRVFQLTFPTRMTNDEGLPHVFEHSTLSGSAKYPSSSLFMNLSNQTYNTYMNAYTTDAMTCYPVASLSEEQLLKLADFYTDSCLNPMIMEDESIYRTEAWRYEMADPDSDLTYNGTVYSEMLGSRTISRASLMAANKATFPGASVSYDYGGDPDHIPEMTWEELKEYHRHFYHPSNCLALLYGSFNDYTAFLKLLNNAFEPFGKADFVFNEDEYTPVTEPVISTFAYPMAEGTDPANQAEVFYYIICPEMKGDIVQESLIDHACSLMNDSASPLMLSLRKAFPTGSFSVGREVAAPVDAILIHASGVNEGDAEPFKQIVDTSLNEIAGEGFASELVDNIVTSMVFNAKLISEEGNPVETFIYSIAYDYAVTGNIFAYVDFYESLDQIESENKEGLLAGAVSKWMKDPDLYTLTTGVPAPGAKELHDAELNSKLSEIKAEMTDEEKLAVIAGTSAEPAEEDNSAMVAELTAVSVSTLPEEIKEYEVRDQNCDGGFRRIEVVAGVDGISYVMLNLDAAALPQEDIHYMRLFTRLLGKMDTDRHSWEELDSLITRYLYNSTFGVFVSGTKGYYHPYIVAEWYSLDEDLETGYQLVEEILYHTQFSDTDTLLERIQAQKNAVRSQINQSAYSVILYRQLGITSPFARYYSYLNFLDYYVFLENLETAMQDHPEEVAARLEQVQQFFANRSGAIAAAAGNEESLAQNRSLADAFFTSLQDNPSDPVIYDLPVAAKKEGLIIDGNIQFNLIAVPWDEIDKEADGTAYSALGQLITDKLLFPVLRDQMGAYGAYCESTDEEVYLFTYRDPNVAETFSYFDMLPDTVASMDVDQETVNNYIVSTYSSLAHETGELAGAVSLINNRISGIPDDIKIKSMRALKTATPDSLADFAGYLSVLLNTDIRGTAGSAAAIAANAEMYDAVLNPFNVEAAGDTPIGDVPEDHPNADAIAAVTGAGAMYGTDGSFRPSDSATVGDLAYAFYVLGMGAAPADASTAYQTFAEYGLMIGGADVAEELTYEALNSQLKNFLKKGYDYDLTDTFTGAGETVTRGELAQVLYEIWLEE